jgi:hypothetical protein
MTSMLVIAWPPLVMIKAKVNMVVARGQHSIVQQSSILLTRSPVAMQGTMQLLVIEACYTGGAELEATGTTCYCIVVTCAAADIVTAGEEFCVIMVGSALA